MMRAIGVKLLEQRMESFLSGVFFDGESSCDELMVIDDAVSGDIDLIYYALELSLRQVSVTLTHSCLQLFNFDCAAVIHIYLVEFFT